MKSDSKERGHISRSVVSRALIITALVAALIFTPSFGMFGGFGTLTAPGSGGTMDVFDGFSAGTADVTYAAETPPLQTQILFLKTDGLYIGAASASATAVTGSEYSGSYSWNAATQTLTLTDFGFATSAPRALTVEVSGTTVIDNAGDCSISVATTSEWPVGIYAASGNLTIRSSNATGSLSVLVNRSGAQPGDGDIVGVHLDRRNLRIESGTVRVECGDMPALYSGYSEGIVIVGGSYTQTGGTVTVRGGNVSGTAERDSIGMDARGGMSIAGGTITAIGQTHALVTYNTSGINTNNISVPMSNYRYWTNGSASEAGATEKVFPANGAFAGSSSYKYVKIQQTDPPPVVAVTDIQVNAAKLKINAGESLLLSDDTTGIATVLPAGATNKQVYWEITDPGETGASLGVEVYYEFRYLDGIPMLTPVYVITLYTVAGKTGAIALKAIVPNGVSNGVNFEKNFTFTIVDADDNGWNVGYTAPGSGVVATVMAATDAVSTTKSMVKDSQWSSTGDPGTWSNSALTLNPGQTYYIFTPLSGMNSGTTAVLPDIKADVTVDMDPDITSVGSYFMAWYANGCNLLTSMGAPNISSLSSVGNHFMTCYANACGSLISLGVPYASKLTSVGDYFMRYYAYGCRSLTSLGVPDTSKISSVGMAFMDYYAYGCDSLTSLDVPDTSKITRTHFGFLSDYAAGCSSLTSLGVPDTSKVTGASTDFMAGYAYGCSSLTSLSIPDTSSLTGIAHTFMSSYAAGCSSLTSLGVPDTSKLTIAGDSFMAGYAKGCSSLTSLGMPDTSKMTEAERYFMEEYARNCNALTSLGVPDTSKMTTVGNYFMRYYAAGCSSLTSLAVPDTSKLTEAERNFMEEYARNCNALTSLGVPDTSKMTTVGNYFMRYYAAGCSSLTSLAVPDTSKLTSVGNYFMVSYADSCTSLDYLTANSAPGWFANHDISLGIPEAASADGNGLRALVPKADIETWKPLTAEGRTLYINYIRDTSHVISDKSGGVNDNGGGGNGQDGSGDKGGSGDKSGSGGKGGSDDRQNNPGNNVGKTVKVTGVKTMAKIYVVKGKSVKLPVAVSPAGAANKGVTWSVKNKKIAKINAKTGKLKALKKGKTVVTVTSNDGKKTFKCKVYVVAKAVKLKGLKITPKIPSGAQAAVSLSIGKTLQIKTKLSPGKATGIVPKYKSSKPAIATVDAMGNITTLAPGKTTIKVMAGKLKKSFVLNVRK